MWVGLRGALTYAIPELERQSFPIDDPGAAGYNPSTSSHIATNYNSLLKDIDCINDLCIIGRNLLATRQAAQDLAADAKFDQHILKLIDVCVRIAARGYDGEANARTEERWQKIVFTCRSLYHSSLPPSTNIYPDGWYRTIKTPESDSRLTFTQTRSYWLPAFNSCIIWS